ncbi:hypothetical protein ASF20_21505 [Methylobacterium sp. Leaf88]|nr:hypothetical protein ASF20_21505 [Methylobacterium sp. Leaf88]
MTPVGNVTLDEAPASLFTLARSLRKELVQNCCEDRPTEIIRPMDSARSISASTTGQVRSPNHKGEDAAIDGDGQAAFRQG